MQTILEISEADQLAAIEEQDDQIAEAVYRMRKEPIDRQHVPALTDKTFPTTIKEKDLVFVLYYLICKHLFAFSLYSNR